MKSPDQRTLHKPYSKELRRRQTMKHARKFCDYKSDSKTSKVWIMPDGEVYSLDTMHHRWIFQNLQLLKDQYRVDFSKFHPDDESVRLEALNNGFVRINYQHGTGTLTIESNARRFDDLIRSAVRFVVANSASLIDSIRVHLLNCHGQIVESGFAMVFDSEDAEKIRHIPLVSGRPKNRAR